MFCPRDLPSFEEVRDLTRDLPGVEPSAIFAALRTLAAADALAHAVEGYLRAHFGVSTGRFSLLMILHRHPELELTPSDLAERGAVSRATVTGLLDGLEKDGLVARGSHSRDRRRITVELTPAGRDFIARLIPEQAPRLSALASPLSETERWQLVRLLDKLEGNLHVLRALVPDVATR